MKVQAELHLSHRNLDGCYLPGTARIDLRTGITQVHVVEDIESVCAELELVALAQQQVFR